MTLPRHIEKKWRAGTITDNGFANLLRLGLLLKYGGIWLDATVLCTAEEIPAFISESPFFAYSSWQHISGDVRPISNWCLAAAPGHTFIRAIYACLCKYWADHDDLVNYFIFHIFFRMLIDKYPDLWRMTPRVNNAPPHLMQFEMELPYSEKRFAQLKAMSPLHKLTWRVNPHILNDRQSLYHYIIGAFRD